jgi:hypothetical protein
MWSSESPLKFGVTFVVSLVLQVPRCSKPESLEGQRDSYNTTCNMACPFAHLKRYLSKT